jgi:uncharacterized surface protein with fasciclin (FAS1) repeats
MKRNTLLSYTIIVATIVASCGSPQDANQSESSESQSTENSISGGQSTVQDDESAKNIVQVAAGSEDHTTLVVAIQAAELADVLVNAGPFTVFAPTNAAFDALPEGTVADLLKPENIETLSDILQFHVAVAVLKIEYLRDGQSLEMSPGFHGNLYKNNKTMWYYKSM